MVTHYYYRCCSWLCIDEKEIIKSPLSNMQKVKIHEPSTLLLRRNGAKEARIYDKRGRKIYRRYFGGRADNFSVNLPQAGEYYLPDNFDIRDRLPLVPCKVKFTLPEPERNRLKPFRIEYKPDLIGTPARIFTDAGLVEIGPEFNRHEPPTKLFILLHELGHYYYKTEWKTDTFALYWYLKLGYNKSQAFYALTKVLKTSPANMERILNLFNKIK
jgi:hypothetical protein